MDALDCLMTRRSIRKFTKEPVDPELIQAALAAAMAAPSAGNARPWHFVLTTDRALLDRVPDFHPYAAMTRQAQAAILVCAEPALEKYPGYWPIDCAAATENLLLALHAQGLGAVWTGVYPDQPRVEGFRKLLGIPGTIIPHSFVPLGHPDMPSGRVDRFQAERIHRESW
ncbi:MAG: nitroreductase family protein [Deltaproteobacteria bacterium HGW-Deltaproteobacteria-8]|jgi:nitroreductase|nr:MAG: nitroreductase family protein [Deltaproteobacteria bacterium HGW-Deltaproteobacteria-8]